jgi:hypothetical protein
MVQLARRIRVAAAVVLLHTAAKEVQEQAALE